MAQMIFFLYMTFPLSSWWLVKNLYFLSPNKYIQDSTPTSSQSVHKSSSNPVIRNHKLDDYHVEEAYISIKKFGKKSFAFYLSQLHNWLSPYICLPIFLVWFWLQEITHGIVAHTIFQFNIIVWIWKLFLISRNKIPSHDHWGLVISLLQFIDHLQQSRNQTHFVCISCKSKKISCSKKYAPCNKHLRLIQRTILFCYTVSNCW